MHLISILIRFGRPHTILSTSIQVITLYIITSNLQHVDAAALAIVGLTLICCLALNVYIVGLNQITDVAIDKVNKPELPLASGELSMPVGWAITLIAGAISLVLAWLIGPILLMTVGSIFVIGTLYSVPPLRLKRFPVWAALSVAIARGLISNVGVALHYQAVFGGSIPTVTLTVLGIFFFGFAVVIALYKDLPDLVGDQMFAIQTFTTRFGRRQVLFAGQLVLTVSYLLPIVIGLSGLPQPQSIFLLVSHLLGIGLFWIVSSAVNLDNQMAIKRFYMFLWILFYSEFVMLSIYETAWNVA